MGQPANLARRAGAQRLTGSQPVGSDRLVPRLKRVDVSTPGITRRRRGRGFEYLDENGRTIRNEEVIERIKALAIPPAWEDVWICTYPVRPHPGHRRGRRRAASSTATTTTGASAATGRSSTR